MMETKYISDFRVDYGANYQFVYSFVLVGAFYMNVEEQLEFVFNQICALIPEKDLEWFVLEEFKGRVIYWNTNGIDRTSLEFEKWK